MNREQGLRIIRTAVADCLDCDEDSIAAESRLIDDLGADSLDFIDLLFTLEKRFKVKIREGELAFLARLDLSDPAVMRDGFLTLETVEELSRWLPDLAAVEDPARVAPGILFSLIKVETLWLMVERRLATSEGVGP